MTRTPSPSARATQLSEQLGRSLTQGYYTLLKRTESNIHRLPSDVLAMNVTGDAEQVGEYVELEFDEEGEGMSEHLLGMSMQLITIRQDLDRPKVVSSKALQDRFQQVHMESLVVASRLHSQHRATHLKVKALPKNQQDLLGLRLMVDLSSLKAASENIKIELFQLSKVREHLSPPEPASASDGPDGLQFSGLDLGGRVLSREDVMEQLMGLE